MPQFDLRVGHDDAGFGGDGQTAGVDPQRHVLQLLRQRGSDLGHHVVVRHGHVVLADGGLRGRGEDRFGQARAVDQPCRQGDPADDTGAEVVGQAAAGEVPASHALDLHHLELVNDHSPALDCGQLSRHDPRHDVVRHDVGQLLEPPQRQPRQHRSLVRDRGREDHVVRREAVARDEQDLVVAVRVDVAHLAGVQERERERHGASIAGRGA